MAFINTKIHSVFNTFLTYTTKVVQSKRHDFVEEISCCNCHVFHTDEELIWADPFTGESSHHEAPYCHSCYDKAFDFRMAA